MKTRHFATLIAALVAGIMFATASLQGAIIFTEDFETPDITAGTYAQGTTPTGWVRADQGYHATYHGIIDSNSGALFTPPPAIDPDDGTTVLLAGGDQSYAFRYTNSGLTSGEGQITASGIQAETVYRVVFGGVQDVSGTNPDGYNALLYALDSGVARNDARSNPTGAAVLDSVSKSNGWSDGSTFYDSMTYTSGLFSDTNLGRDLTVRFRGATSSAIIDSVVVEATALYPNAYWNGGTTGGVWDTDVEWNDQNDLLGTDSAWTVGRTAVFGAGTTDVGVNGNISIGSLSLNDGLVLSEADGTGDLLTLNRDAAFTVSSGTATMGVGIAGTDIMGKMGAGTLVLTGDNSSFSGETRILAGTLQVGDGTTDGTLGSGAVSNSGVLSFNVAGSQTVGNNISGTGSLTKDGAGTVTLSGSNNYAGGTTISAGKVQVGGDGHLGTAGVAIGAAGELEYTGSATIPTLSGSGTLTLSSGTATVSSDNSAFSGATNVSGTLVVNGSLGGTTAILSGGTLMGAGALSSVTVNAGGTLAPGNSIDTITVGDLTLSGTYEWEVDNAGSDLVVVDGTLGTGSLDISGDVIVDITPLDGAYFSASQVFTLFTYDGTLTTDGLANDLTVTYGGIASKWLTQGAIFADTGIAITLTGIEYIPEPSTMILAGLGLAGLSLRRRRR
ncbi:MAG: autotransporter-associated beta strand repeat-containing protein [Lentisphaeria bacterium]|nr:autotransporter-associated beta strand repeat-containing protein [Lentisphaeria bacterium]